MARSDDHCSATPQRLFVRPPTAEILATLETDSITRSMYFICCPLRIHITSVGVAVVGSIGCGQKTTSKWRLNEVTTSPACLSRGSMLINQVRMSQLTIGQSMALIYCKYICINLGTPAHAAHGLLKRTSISLRCTTALQDKEHQCLAAGRTTEAKRHLQDVQDV